MASLNLSNNGPSISKSYTTVVEAPAPSGPAAKSSTYGQWAVFSVSAPLASAFQQSTSQESVLKVQSTGEGELSDLTDEFSDGRIQFAFAKVKDPNTTLPKSILIAWCGEGVPERTKGYFTSHTAAVSKILHGYHVQITARSDRDLTPESIVQKVADASGSKYSGAPQPASSSIPPPPISSKPAFTPTQSSGAGGFNPLASKNRVLPRKQEVDEDGWGADAPPVTRTQLEKVQSAYQPTKVDMRELSSQKQEPSRFADANSSAGNDGDVVKGGYQPVGKVDIAALRKESQQQSKVQNDRPEPVKGSYEPVGKVDIAAIRARSQKPSESQYTPPSSISPAVTGTSDRSQEPKSLPDRSAAFSSGGSDRLTSLPKPKVAKAFGSGGYTGTKAPTPGGFGLESQKTPAGPPMGVGRTFAESGGKTPAQLWAEKKAAQGGGAAAPPPTTRPAPLQNQTSGDGGWKSGYAGKSWAPVQTTRTGQSATSSIEQQRTGPQDDIAAEETPSSPAGGISSIRDRFKGAPPMGVAPTSSGADHSAPEPPPLATTTKPSAGGIPMPGLPSRPPAPSPDPVEQETQRLPSPPAQPPRSPTPPTPAIETGSPIRVAMPVARGASPEIESAREEQMSPPPAMPTRSLAQAVPLEKDIEDDTQADDSARAAGQAAAREAFTQRQVEEASHPAQQQQQQAEGGAGGLTAVAQYDYEKAEENELEMKEGEEITEIEQVDPDWWHGRNSRGSTGLFPSNYVELTTTASSSTVAPTAPSVSAAAAPSSQGQTATTLYDYEAAEGNELSFPEGVKITNVEFPDESWWSGEYKGVQGLFPSNYVQLDE